MSLLEVPTERELTTDAAPQPRVVLALDAASTAASMVEWAAHEAIARNAALQIVTSSVASCSSESCAARHTPAVMEAVTATRERHPLLSIEETTVRLDTQHELIDTAAGADLLIVGAPYLGISTRHLLGSAAGVAVRRRSCPVIALRGQQRQPLRRIAVGADDSNAAAIASDWAADEADRHGAELTIIHVWQQTDGGHSLGRINHDRDAALRILDEAADRCAARLGRAVSCELIEGLAAPALAAASMNADLIAVGSRGSSGFKTMLFGPVTRFVLASADCPVAVIHPRVRVA